MTQYIHFGDPVHFLSVVHGKYLSAERNGDLIADRRKAGDYEVFTLESANGSTGPIQFNDQIYIKSAHQKFITVSITGVPLANRQTPHETETFVIYDVQDYNSTQRVTTENQVLFQAHTGKIFATEPDGKVSADRAQWEYSWDLFYLALAGTTQRPTTTGSKNVKETSPPQKNASFGFEQMHEHYKQEIGVTDSMAKMRVQDDSSIFEDDFFTKPMQQQQQPIPPIQPIQPIQQPKPVQQPIQPLVQPMQPKQQPVPQQFSPPNQPIPQQYPPNQYNQYSTGYSNQQQYRPNNQPQYNNQYPNTGIYPNTQQYNSYQQQPQQQQSQQQQQVWTTFIDSFDDFMDNTKKPEPKPEPKPQPRDPAPVKRESAPVKRETVPARKEEPIRQPPRTNSRASASTKKKFAIQIASRNMNASAIKVSILDEDNVTVYKVGMQFSTGTLVLDAENKKVGSITRESMHIHNTFAIFSNKGKQLAQCKERFKFSERKFNYKRFDSGAVLKMVGDFGSGFRITKNDSVIAAVRPAKTGYTMVIDSTPTDVFHSLMLSLIMIETQYWTSSSIGL